MSTSMDTFWGATQNICIYTLYIYVRFLYIFICIYIYAILCNLGTYCNLCYQAQCIHYLHRTAKVMFSSLLVCVSVCLSVCLLATLRRNVWTDFHDFLFISFIYLFIYFFWGGLGTRNNLKHSRDVPFSPLNTWNLFQHFRGNPCL